MVWESDKVLPVMMMFLASSIFWWFVYFVFVVYTERYILWQYSDSESFNCSGVWIENLPAFTLSIGVILNLNKWI